MSTRSLNQIRREILAFARGHGQIVSAKFCNPWDLLDDGDVKFPALWFWMSSARKDKSELVMSFNASVADLLHPEKDNEGEIISDTQLIACDLLAYLDGPDRDYRLQDGSPIRPFTDSTPDNIAGVVVDFTLRVPFPYDRCIIPQKPVGFLLGDFNEDFDNDFNNQS